jgi:hypothetical protein
VANEQARRDGTDAGVNERQEIVAKLSEGKGQ